MHAEGVRRAAAFVTSAFGSYSGCRQYREDIARAQQTAGVQDMVIEKLPNFCDRPEFIEAMTDRVRAAMEELSQRSIAKLAIANSRATHLYRAQHSRKHG